ncbi:MAG TPA: hypothetical protein VMN99_07655 [Anaerolineales bacterium]|nr:hypothetical protein [Anaerolineales bacterium]
MMIKFERNPVCLTSPANSHEELEYSHCLIVLVPTGADHSTATRQIWKLANTTGMNVQLLGVCKDPAEEPSLHRELVTMASLLQDARIRTAAKVDIGTNWVEAVKTIYNAGDLIVCFAEQCTGLLHRPLSQVLESNLKATVYILSGLTPRKSKSNNLTEISTWLGFIGIIIGFAILQTKVVQLPEGWLQSVLLILSIIPEFGLIWVWNGLFN